MFKVQTEGDAFFVAFADAISAVRACAQAQRSLIEEPWPVDAVVRVRMGVHSGLASPHGDDYTAFAVHQAARVVDAGHGGQIVVSCDTARHFFAIDDLALAPLGRFRVRDFDDPVELFQVTGVGLPDRFAPLRILPADRHNLVRASTSLVGRSDDLAALHELFGTSRLVSAVGPGGLGKTRLATESPSTAGASSTRAARAPPPCEGRYAGPSGHTSPKPSAPLSVVIRTTVLGRVSMTLFPDITYLPWTYVRSYP
jgi:hypothetical protein